MTHKKRNFLLLVIFLSLMVVANSSITAKASATDQVVFGTINDAFYGDLDGNGNSNDIQFNLSVYISNFQTSNSANGYYLTLLEGLEYPDGTTVWVQFNLIAYVQSFNANVIWYNSVTQGGWYTAHSYSFSTYGHDKAYYSCLTFDPPTAGVTGSPPD